MKRLPTTFEAISLLIVMLIVFSGGTVFSMNYVPLMMIVAAYAMFICWRCGYSYKEMEKAISNKIGKSVPVLSIFLCVGLLVGALMYCGTIPMLIYYGTQMLSAKWLYLCAFLLCAIFSLLTGTCVGSVSTAGLAMMSIGMAMPDANLGLLAGAIISGATIGDKVSPLSDTTIMSAAVTDNDVYDHIKHQSKVVLPAAGITLLVYVAIGLFTHTNASSTSEVSMNLLASLDSIYKWNVLLLLPVVFVVWGILSKKSTVVTLVGASFIGLIIGIAYQGFDPADGVKALYQGFACKMAVAGNPNLDIATLSTETVTLIERGGLTSMTKTFLAIFICYHFAAAAELCGALKVLLNLMSKFIKNTFTLVLSTGVSMIIMEALCGSSTPAAALAGPLFKGKYEEMGLHSLNLAREIEDFGTGSTAFIPWSSTGLTYVGILGLTNMIYLKYTFFCWLVWIIALVYAATGIGIRKLKDEKVTATNV